MKPVSQSVLGGLGTKQSLIAYHFGVWPPRLSVSVFLASFPSLAAQYGSCLPMVFRFGRFLALSTMMTRSPISGPSTVMSEKMPAVCIAAVAVFGKLILDVIVVDCCCRACSTVGCWWRKLNSELIRSPFSDSSDGKAVRRKGNRFGWVELRTRTRQGWRGE